MRGSRSRKRQRFGIQGYYTGLCERESSGFDIGTSFIRSRHQQRFGIADHHIGLCQNASSGFDNRTAFIWTTPAVYIFDRKIDTLRVMIMYTVITVL